MVVQLESKGLPGDVEGSIEIDQQAQSDGLSKIKAVNNDPVSHRMTTAI
jgi:hypothetical protein